MTALLAIAIIVFVWSALSIRRTKIATRLSIEWVNMCCDYRKFLIAFDYERYNDTTFSQFTNAIRSQNELFSILPWITSLHDYRIIKDSRLYYEVMQHSSPEHKEMTDAHFEENDRKIQRLLEDQQVPKTEETNNEL